MSLRILFIGDVVGSPGRKIVGHALPRLVPRLGIGLVVCNAENAAGGSGLTEKTYDELVESGVDVFTMGDHVYRKDEILNVFGRTDRICRPANLPPDAPGPEMVVAEARDGTRVGVFTVLGRTFMRPVDCPLRTSDRLVAELERVARVIVVDVHAEATSDKQLLARYLDGRVSAVLGTHTHVATADERILAGGTAYQSDVGMTGPYESVIGRRYDDVLKATLTALPVHLDVATGDARFCGALVDVDPASGRAVRISRVRIDRDEAQAMLTDRGLPESLAGLAPA
jgi:metallophosphoesterase (TIGR00282 family)